MEALGVLLVLALLAGSVGGLMSLFRYRALHERLQRMERKLAELSTVTGAVEPATTATTPEPAPATARIDKHWREELPSHSEQASAAVAVAAPKSPSFTEQAQRHLQQHWMIWLGGLCVALAGVFLARYSIEIGLLGPRARLALGIFTGLALYAGAEWLRRKTGGTHPAFAALAGGGSITLFAVLLAALHLYGLLSPGATFVLLAIVALGTMCLAYIHGPALAAIGILGAYVVPILVSTGSGQILFAMGYSLVISASALLLLRYIYRPWLWWGLVIGGLGWWGISLSYDSAEGLRGWYLAGLGYLMLAIPAFDWRLSRSVRVPGEDYRLLLGASVNDTQEDLLPRGLLLLLAAQAVSVVVEHTLVSAALAWSPLLVLVLWAARSREQLSVLPWLLVIMQIVAIVLTRLHSVDGRFQLLQLDAAGSGHLFGYVAATSLITVVFALYNIGPARFKAIWSSLLALAPLFLIALAYFLTQRFTVNLQWSLLTAALAVAYLGVATVSLRKSSVETLVVWLFLGGHFALSLAAIMITRNASLTLVFALQLISIGWIIKHFRLPGLGWLLKIMVAVTIFRLSFNPWIVGYPADVHWSLWTFGGATACCVAAARLLREYPLLARWAEASAMHLLVLTLWTELRYWLYGGNVFERDFTLLEVSLYMVMFGGVGLVYYRRSLVSQHLQTFCQMFARVLLLLALASYSLLLVATLLGDSWVWADIGSTPIANLMLLAFGAPVLLGLLTYWLFEPRYRSWALMFAGLSFFVFVTLQIRHLWQGNIGMSAAASGGELYTYSAAWLLMAIAAILGGAWRFGERCYRAGMALLGLVIAKLFLVDMSDLEGLLRVASFMGLGLGLLGISYLHQQIQKMKPGSA